MADPGRDYRVVYTVKDTELAVLVSGRPSQQRLSQYLDRRLRVRPSLTRESRRTDPLAVRRCWLAKAKRVCSPGEGKGDGSLLRPKLLPVGAFGKDHLTQASNFDTGVQDAAEVVHRLAPSGSMSFSTTRSQASPPRPGFVVGPRIG